MFTQFIHPFTMLVAGPSMCGKSTFLQNVITKQHAMFNLIFNRILWCYSETAAKPDIRGVEFHKGMPDDIEISHNGPQLLILDDLMSDAFSARVSDIFTKGSHHRNISIILVTQNIFHQGTHSRDISLNTKYLVLFKNPRDRQQFNFIARQIYPENSKELVRVYNEVTKAPHSYLIIDLTQNINDLLRFRTDIFSKDYLAVVFSNIQSNEPETETVEGQQAYVVYT